MNSVSKKYPIDPMSATNASCRRTKFDSTSIAGIAMVTLLAAIFAFEFFRILNLIDW